MVQLIDINNLYIDEDGDWALSYEIEKLVIIKRKKRYYSNLKPIIEEVKEQKILRKSDCAENLYQNLYNFDINNITFYINKVAINLFNLCPIIAIKKN